MNFELKHLLLTAALCVAASAAHAESCITTGNTTTSNVATTIGTFFQIGGSDVVRAANPPGINNAMAVISNGGVLPSPGLSCGATAKAGGDGAVAVGQQANAQGKGAVAVGTGAIAPAQNSVALGGASIANQPNTVSVGSQNNTRRITNVSDGSAPTDAANVSQLLGATSNLQQQINQSRREYRAGISMAMAAAALQTGAGASGPGKVAIGMGGGEFAGTASLSAGIAYSPVSRLNFNAGVSVAPAVGMFGVFGGSTLTLN